MVDLNRRSKTENYTALHFLMDQKQENESEEVPSFVSELMLIYEVSNILSICLKFVTNDKPF